MILIIDTSTDIYTFGLYSEKFKKNFSVKRDDKKDALFFIDKFLTENHLGVKDLKAISVYNGPGSYTGVRVGVTIANALSYSLKIPVFGFKHKSMSDKTRTCFAEPCCFTIKKEIWKELLKKKYKTDNFVRVKY